MTGQIAPTTLTLRAVAIAATVFVAACQNTSQPSTTTQTPRATRSAPAVAPEKATFAFEPFTGAPGNTADQLSELIGHEAREQGLTLVRRVGAPASYRINGYLAATGNQSSVTLFYVFDVVDASGSRVHRIIGQESAPGTSGDPWSGIEGDTLSLVAKRSVASLRAWLYR